MEQVENRTMIEVCLNCPRRTCHPVHCARYEAALRKLGPGVTRKRKLYFAWGEWNSITGWARACGISKKVLYDRVVERGWSMERAMSEPVRRGRQYVARGMTLSVPEWSAALGISDDAIYARLRQGWDMERIAAHYGGRK